MTDLTPPDSVTPPAVTDSAAAAPLPERRGHWSASLLGLLACVGLFLWCQHWLSSAQFFADGTHPAQTSRYIQAMLLTLPAVSGVCYFGNRLWRGRWLLWLALVLLVAECLVLIGTFVVLRLLGTSTPLLTTVLAVGLAGCLAAGYYVWYRRRQPHS